MSFKNEYTGAPFAQTQEDIQRRANWIQLTEQGGDVFLAAQQGEPQIHQISQATQHAEPTLHQPLPYQQQVFPNQQTEKISFKNEDTSAPFAQTQEDIQQRANWIQLTEQGGDVFLATQQGEPQIHQISQATQHAEPTLHQPLPYQQQVFPNQQTEEINQVLDFKKQLPLSRIKKIMKANEDVKKISGDAAAVLGKACELFIQDLTHRSWIHTEDNGRRTLQRNDIVSAITPGSDKKMSEIFCFCSFRAKPSLSPDRGLR